MGTTTATTVVDDATIVAVAAGVPAVGVGYTVAGYTIAGEGSGDSSTLPVKSEGGDDPSS